MSIVYTPVQHQVFNELDRIGILLGLKRLESERNPEYKQRLLDVFVNRAGSTYRGLINGITRELGLELFDAFTIEPKRSSVTGLTLGANPVVIFNETKCLVYSDYSLGEDGLELEIERFDQDAPAYILSGLVNLINSTGYFVCNIISGVNGNTRAMTVFNQSTIATVPSEALDLAGARIKLQNENLVDGSVVVRSTNLVERVDAQDDLVSLGQYYIDTTQGVIYSTVAPASGSAIRYQFRNDDYIARASPVIIHNIQSTDFRSKMFDQMTLSGETTDGAPTGLGAELINELLSVYPIGWGS